MARSAQTALLLLAILACSSCSQARSLRSLQQPAIAASVVSSSSTPRRVLAGRVELPHVAFAASVAVKPVVAVAAAAAAEPSSAAPLPADIAVTAAGCAAVQQQPQPGARATATFTVAAPTAPELFKEVALQVDFPRALWPGASLACVDSRAQAIACPAPEFTPEQLSSSDDLLATACMLGDMAATGPVTCTFTYTVPAAAAAAASSSSGSQVLAAVTFNPLPANAVENSENNAAFACTAA